MKSFWTSTLINNQDLCIKSDCIMKMAYHIMVPEHEFTFKNI